MAAMSQRQKRRSNLRKRIAEPQDAYERCRVFPCANRTTADRGEGLNRLYCRKHIEFYRRHGSYVKRSYGAGELRIYRLSALAWLQERVDDPGARLAIAEVERLYRSAGATVEAFRLAGKTPADRARAIWAQLRSRQIKPIHVLAAWCAVEMRIADDAQPDRHDEYRHVQVAKALHRMSGGTHKRWERSDNEGRAVVSTLHKHPVSRGRVLRIVGSDIYRVCAHLDIQITQLQP
jgi:hypothetical protein